ALYTPDSRSDHERQREAMVATVEDYRRRFCAAHQAGLAERVPLPITVGRNRAGGGDVSTVARIVGAERAALIVGSTGHGKTHLADHAAIALSQDRGVVIWLRASEYRAGALATLMARS